jgi:tRNA dimethylallyltransferase
VVAILGPTASGKSALALELGRATGRRDPVLRFHAGLSRHGHRHGQGHARRARGGTASPSRLVSPGEQFHAAAWAEAAQALIRDAEQRERLPIIVGGTGLYYRALGARVVRGPTARPARFARATRPRPPALGIPALHERLRLIDPEAAAKILPGDLVRISRALEVYEQTGATISEQRRQPVAPAPLRVFSVLLEFDMDHLRARIAARVDHMMSAGFLDEVRGLRAAGFASARSMQALGYKQMGLAPRRRLVLGGGRGRDQIGDRGLCPPAADLVPPRGHQPALVPTPVTSALARLLRGWLLT